MIAALTQFAFPVAGHKVDRCAARGRMENQKRI